MANLNPSVKINLNDLKGALIDKINSKIPEYTEAIAFTVEAEVKKAFTTFPKPPIQTGNLRRNIRASKRADNTFEVRASTPLVIDRKGKGNKSGREVEYASFVEYGTYKMPPRPFFRVGIQNALPKIEKILERLFKF